jgi:hypothetical protein
MVQVVALLAPAALAPAMAAGAQLVGMARQVQIEAGIQRLDLD